MEEIIFAIFFIGILITFIIFSRRDTTRGRKLEENIEAFNNNNEKRQLGTQIMNNAHIKYKGNKLDFDMRLHEVSETYAEARIRSNKNVYLGTIKPKCEIVKEENIYVELCIADEDLVVIDSKVFNFKYINDSWEQSMEYFFDSYRLCLGHYRLYDEWDHQYFQAVLPSLGGVKK